MLRPRRAAAVVLRQLYLLRGSDALVPFVAPIAVATLGCVLGTIAGERLFLRIPRERYRTVVGVAVIVLGAWLMLS